LYFNFVHSGSKILCQLGIGELTDAKMISACMHLQTVKIMIYIPSKVLFKQKEKKRKEKKTV
jgi:hypothetical protein